VPEPSYITQTPKGKMSDVRVAAMRWIVAFLRMLLAIGQQEI